MRIAPNLRPVVICIAMLMLCMASRSLAQNPVAYWPFSGNAQDASGNGHNGTVSGATLTTDRFGNANSAYKFNATSKTFIQVSHHPQLSFGTAPFSICAWVKVCSQHDDYAGVVVKGPTQIFYPGYQLVLTRNNRIMTQLGDQAMLGVERRGQRALNDGLWHFLVLTVSQQSRDIRMYVDGVLESYTETFSSSAPYNVSMVDNTPLYIGKERNSVVYFTGSIDDIRIFNSALSGSEIQTFYHENGWTGTQSAGGNSIINVCQGNPTTLNAGIFDSYRWSNNARTRSITVNQPGVYWVIGTDAGGCTRTDTFTVKAFPAPQLQVPSVASICQGEAVSIGMTATSGTPPYSYSWSPRTGLSTPDVATTLASPQKATTYVLTVTDANGCTAVDSVTVNIKPSPVMSVQSQSFCEGFGPVTIGARATGGSGIYTYSWSPASGLSATDVAQPIANPDTTTTYQVRVTDANGCATVASVTVTVNTKPVASAGPDIDLCTGGSATIGQPASGGTAPYSYSWTPATGLNTTDIATPTVSPEQPTRYTVIVTDANGCRDTASVMVDIQPGTLKILSASSQTPFLINAMNRNARECDSVRLINTGTDTLVIDAAYLQKNLKFSVPPSQLPLTILPGVERSLYICYTPTFDEQDDDTLYLQSECFYQVAVTGHGISPVLQGSDICGSLISVRQDDTGKAFLRVLAPYPNPASTSIVVPIEKFYPAGQEIRQERCLLYDALGNLISQGIYVQTFQRQQESGGKEEGMYTLDVQSLASGLYFVHVGSDTGKLILPVIVGQ